MREFLTILLVLICAQEGLAVMVDGYCYLAGETEHSGTKVKFIEASPSAVTDSTYTEMSGYFYIVDLAVGIYDVEYTNGGFDTTTVDNQLFTSDTTVSPVWLYWRPISGPISGTLGPGTYHIWSGGLWVELDSTLRIMPGTTFICFGHGRFTIYGTLLAEGTESDSIIFISDTLMNPDRFGGLRFQGSGSSGSQLSYCTIQLMQRIEESGGGVYCWESSPSLTHCTITGNEARNGGGVYLRDSSPGFTNCIISSNSADGQGGGVHCYSSSPSFTNCTISGNSATNNWDCGGVYCYDSSPVFNNTIIAFSHGPGVFFSNSFGSQFEYCDIFGNEGGDISFAGDDPSHGPPAIGQLLATNANGDSCDIYLNIFIDPMFVDTVTDDFHLQYVSPCIDAGNPDLPYDPDGTVSDIGAFHYNRQPSTFGLISPQWGDTCWTLDTVLVWQSAVDPEPSDSVSYEVWLDTLSDLSTAWEAASGLSDTVFYLTQLADHYAYYWTVHASDLNTPGTWANDTLMFYTYSDLAVSSESVLLPKEFALHQNYPNPFNPTTTVRYDVKQSGQVRLTIYSLLGQEVTRLVDGRHLAGSYAVSWDAADLPSGIYLCRMEAPDFVQTRKLVLLK